MKRNQLFFCLLAMIIVVITYGSCSKNSGDYDYVNPKVQFNGTTYEYLKSQTGVFDSLILVIDRLNLSDALKNEQITLFAPTNLSFKLAVEKLNTSKKKSGAKLVWLSTYDQGSLDSMVCRYLLPGVLPSDSLASADGVTRPGIRYNYPMNSRRTNSRAQGVQNGGAALIVFSDTRRSGFKTTWLSANANAIDVITKNGIVHVLESGHLFGFNDFFKPNRSPYKGKAFQFPSALNTPVILEAEDFDEGGQNVAYYATANKNASGNYRPNTGFNLGQHGSATTPAAAGITWPASYDIFEASSGDWLIYTINVAQEGDYQIQTRYRNRNAKQPTSQSSYHFDIDFVNVTGSITNVGIDPYAAWSFSTAKVHLSPGIHAMRFNFEISGMEIDSYYITRLK